MSVQGEQSLFTNSKPHLPPGGIRATLGARRTCERAAVRRHGTRGRRRVQATRLQPAKQQQASQRQVSTRHQAHQVWASATQE
jgi:hypothetical protein